MSSKSIMITLFIGLQSWLKIVQQSTTSIISWLLYLNKNITHIECLLSTLTLTIIVECSLSSIDCYLSNRVLNFLFTRTVTTLYWCTLLIDWLSLVKLFNHISDILFVATKCHHSIAHTHQSIDIQQTHLNLSNSKFKI